MKEKLINVLTSKKFGLVFCGMIGAVAGGFCYLFGKASGEYTGIMEANDIWFNALKEKVEKKEENETE